MEISPLILAKMLFVAFLLGIQIGVIFDLGRAVRALIFGDVRGEKMKRLYSLRLPFPQKKILKNDSKINCFFRNLFIFLFDFLWVIYSFTALIKVNYSYNNGGIRFFTVAAMLIGFFSYYFTLSHIVIFLTELVFFLPRYTFFAIFDAVSLPFFKIYNNLVKKIKKCYEKLRLRIEKKNKKVYNVCEIVYKNASDDCKRKKVKISIRKK